MKMEISQSGLARLLLYSAVGGAILGMLYLSLILVRAILGCESAEKGKWILRVEEAELPLIKRKMRKIKQGGSLRFLLDFVLVLCDVVFVVLSGIAVILISYAYNGGQVRLAVIFGVSIGFFLCRCTIGRAFVQFSGALAVASRVFLEYLYEFVLCPLKLVRCINKKMKCIKKKRIKNKRKGAKNEI